MKPAASIILFTTLAGLGQGMAVVLAAATLWGAAPGQGLAAAMLWVATALLVIALCSSFFHLGHPLRAWRAAVMWRTSWMSREVIVLPLCIAIVAAWALLVSFRARNIPTWIPVSVLAVAVVLWYCTAMIYACIRFIREWAHPLTIVNYILLGLSSGLVATCTMAEFAGEQRFGASVEAWALAITTLAWFTRGLSLRRNRNLKPVSTTQSATGIHAQRVVQTSMGMTGGSFNTREFFHGASSRVMKNAKLLLVVFTFAIPIMTVGVGMAVHASGLFLVAAAAQYTGLLIERWFFFAQARHPQNIYYDVVS